MSDNRTTAEKIADYLFTNGASQKAQRLVLELEENGMYGGGWRQQAVVDAVERILKERPMPETTPVYPVQTAMQEAVGDLPPDLQRFVVERVKKFLRALPCDGTSVPVTGARYEGKTTNYDPSILASYIGSWPL